MEHKHTVIETRLLMELVASKATMDAVMNFLRSKQRDGYCCGLDCNEVEMLLVMFGKENNNA